MSTLRPDVVLVSETTRKVVLLELTVPWKDRTEEAFERKRAKYEELAGPDATPLRSGTDFFVGQSLIMALKMLGVKGLQKRKAIRDTSVAEKASRWLWMKQGDPWATQAGA